MQPLQSEFLEKYAIPVIQSAFFLRLREFVGWVQYVLKTMKSLIIGLLVVSYCIEASFTLRNVLLSSALQAPSRRVARENMIDFDV